MEPLQNEPLEYQIKYIRFVAELFKDRFQQEKDIECIDNILNEFEQDPSHFFTYKNKYEIINFSRFTAAYVSWASVLSRALPNFSSVYKEKISISPDSFFQLAVDPFIYAFYIKKYPNEARIKTA